MEESLNIGMNGPYCSVGASGSGLTTEARKDGLTVNLH